MNWTTLVLACSLWWQLRKKYVFSFMIHCPFLSVMTLKWYWNVSLHFTSFKQVKTFLVISRITFLHPIITCRELSRASLSLLALEWHSYLRVRFKLRNGVSGLNNILSLLIHYRGRGNYCFTGIAVPGTCPTYCMKIMSCFLFTVIVQSLDTSKTLIEPIGSWFRYTGIRTSKVTTFRVTPCMPCSARFSLRLPFSPRSESHVASWKTGRGCDWALIKFEMAEMIAKKREM